MTEILSTIKEIIRFARVYKKFWIVPLMIGLFVIGGILVMAEGSAIAPLIYAIF